MKKWTLCVCLLLAVTACASAPAGTAPVTATTSPPPAPSAEAPAPGEPGAEEEGSPRFPVLAAQDRKWCIYIDAWGGAANGDNTIDISIYERDGTPFQKLSNISLQPGPGWKYRKDPRYEQPVALVDLNFDGLPDIRVICNTTRCTTYRAFLWDKETEQFAEEPTLERIPRPYPMQGMIFGNCSSGANNTAFYAYGYDREHGYQLVRYLSIDFSYENEWEGARYTESFYEDGEVVHTVQTMDDLSQNEFWKDYSDYADEYVFG